MNEFKTYSFYTQKRQRIAAFAVRQNNQLRIGLLFCSRKDQFSKTLAMGLYPYWIETFPEEIHYREVIYHIRNVIIPVVDDKPKKSFLDWMKSNYYKMREQRIRYNQKVLVKSGERIISYGKPVEENQKLSNIW